MKKKVSLSTLITSCIMIATITFAVSMILSREVYNQMLYEVGKREEQYMRISEVDGIVRDKYIHNIDEEYLSDNILNGYIKGLNDPYSYYLTAEERAKQEEEYVGSRPGIGIKAVQESGFIKVVEVYKDSPAEVAGLMSEDLIIAVNGVPITRDPSEGSLTYENALLELQGEEGSKVDLTYRRANDDTEMELVRRVVNIPSVMYGVLDDGTTGYLRIVDFYDNTPSQFNNAINDLLNTHKINGIIFDVRNNSGGTLNSVVDVLDRVLEKDTKIVSYIDKKGLEDSRKALSDEFLDIPIVVLTNNKTASAAELFTIAIRDYDKGDVVGQTTLGKGTMQELIKLNDGSAIRLSVARYQSPKSGSYDKIGIKPTFEVALNSEQDKFLSNTSFDTYSLVALSTDDVMKKSIDVLNNLKRVAGIDVENISVPAENPDETSAVGEGELSIGEQSSSESELEQSSSVE